MQQFIAPAEKGKRIGSCVDLAVRDGGTETDVPKGAIVMIVKGDVDVGLVDGGIARGGPVAGPCARCPFIHSQVEVLGPELDGARVIGVVGAGGEGLDNSLAKANQRARKRAASLSTSRGAVGSAGRS
jgi:hypothetical protein